MKSYISKYINWYNEIFYKKILNYINQKIISLGFIINIFHLLNEWFFAINSLVFFFIKNDIY